MTRYGAVAAIIVIGAGAAVYVGGGGAVIPEPALRTTRISLLASRDMGSLPSRDAWCSGASHCWLFQELSGDAVDYGSPGGRNLSSAAARRGVVISLPVEATTVDTTSELATWTTAATQWFKAAQTQDSTAVVSYTYVYYRAGTATESLWYHIAGTPTGTRILHTSSYGYAYAYGSTALKTMLWALPNLYTPNCETVVIDTRTTTAGRVYRNGAQIATGDLSGAGNISCAANTMFVGQGSYGIARFRIDDNKATSLAEHQALCGTYLQPPAGGVADNKPLVADDSWTQTGAQRCYPMSATTAMCTPGGKTPLAMGPSGLSWPIDRAAINRILYNVGSLNCTNWTCTTATIAAATAPDGSSTAAAITMGGGSVARTATGYASTTALTFRAWVNCASGTLDASNVGGAGRWEIDCTTIGGAWTYVTSTHASISPATKQAWQSQADGTVHLTLSGTDATLWAPTMTEEAGSGYMVVPTQATAVSTGDPVWAIDNDPAVYYRSGDTVTPSILAVSGTCFAVSGSNLLLTGASTCNGLWYGLQVTR